MDSTSQFQQQMARLTDGQLWEVLDTPEDYLPEAIAAAKTEWSARNLSDEEYGRLALEREQHRKHHAGIHWKLLAYYNKGIHQSTSQIGYFLRPLDRISPKSLLRIGAVMLGLMWFLFFWLGRDLLWQLFIPPPLKIGLFVVLLLGYPVGMLGLILQKKWAWIFTHILLIEVCMHHFADYLLTLRTYAEHLQYVSSLPFPQEAIWENIPALIIAVIGLLLLNNRRLRNHVGVSGYEQLRVWLLGLVVLGMVYLSPLF